MNLFAKSGLLFRLRLRARMRAARACALLLAIALVAGGFVAATVPLAVAADTADADGHCADHATPADAGIPLDRLGSHAGDCCESMCTCACTHAISSVPLLAQHPVAPAARLIVFSPPAVRVALVVPPLRPPIA